MILGPGAECDTYSPVLRHSFWINLFWGLRRFLLRTCIDPTCFEIVNCDLIISTVKSFLMHQPHAVAQLWHSLVFKGSPTAEYMGFFLTSFPRQYHWCRGMSPKHDITKASTTRPAYFISSAICGIGTPRTQVELETVPRQYYNHSAKGVSHWSIGQQDTWFITCHPYWAKVYGWIKINSEEINGMDETTVKIQDIVENLFIIMLSVVLDLRAYMRLWNAPVA